MPHTQEIRPKSLLLTKQKRPQPEVPDQESRNQDPENATAINPQARSYAQTVAAAKSFKLYRGPSKFRPADKRDTRKRPGSLVCHTDADGILQRDVLQKVKDAGLSAVCVQKGIGRDFTITFATVDDRRSFEFSDTEEL